MSLLKQMVRTCVVLAIALCFTHCGMSRYPGQPHRVTDGYSKVDIEFLDFEGLWVYEVSYDNRTTDKNVGAIVTKLYPGAQTFTSNARTNADGTLYWHKQQYNGAEMQMIAIPKLNQVMLPANSKVWVLIEWEISENEVDTKNIAEEYLFEPPSPGRGANWAANWSNSLALKWQILRSGKLLPGMNLTYEIVSVEVGDKKFVPSSALTASTNFIQNGVRLNVTKSHQEELIAFIETNFPKGFQGKAKFFLKDVEKPIEVAKLGVHTLKTAEARGVKVIKNATPQMMNDVLIRR